MDKVMAMFLSYVQMFMKENLVTADQYEKYKFVR